jgi:RNA-directed DNA polymerase
MLHHKKRTDDPVAKMMALSRVTRGWGNYYRHVNAKRILSQLDHWTFKTMLAWLTAHHGRGVRWAWRQYVHPQGKRKNLAVRKREGTLLFRHVMADTPQRPYFTDWTRQNPYLTAQQSPATWPEQDVPLTGLEWEGVTSKRMALTYEARQRDQYSCQRCGRQTSLEVHHRKGYRPQDKPHLEDLITLCRQCHLDAHA